MIGGYSEEEERRLRNARGSGTGASAGVELDVSEALRELEAASDSRGIASSLQKVAAKRLLILIGEGKVGGGDLVRLLGLVSDRIDGKVADKVDISVSSRDSIISSVRTLVLERVLSYEAGCAELEANGISSDGILEAEVMDG